ncbi:hypothetical protein C9974_02350 [Marinobacter sp. B9-2]|nr:hypothetical protein C9974_02350 [Marinobacter sp. B9-2]
MILRNALRILVLLLASCVFQFAHADAGPVTLVPDEPIESHFQYWEDTGADATLADVRALPRPAWQARPSGKATFGITDSAYWLRVQVRNQTDHDQLLIAELAIKPGPRFGVASYPEHWKKAALLQDIHTSKSARMIVETAISMGHGLGFQVVAKGVETEQAASLLGSMGADLLQGYWVCRPKSLNDLKTWLETDRKAASLE